MLVSKCDPRQALVSVGHVDSPNGVTQLTWFVAPKKPLEMTVVLKKSARERRRC